MMASADLHDRILDLFSSALNIEVPSVETDLFECGVLDSLAFVELLLQLEREFGVAAALDDLQPENFTSVARIAEFVAARVGATRGRVLSMDRRERLA